MIPYFQRLGAFVEQEWLKQSYDEDVFPQLAVDALSQSPLAGNVEAKDIIDWLFGSSHAFRQPSDRRLFGEPPVMLFRAPRFYIEALFWFSATTDIHEHAFSGAFAVLGGSSVHSHWRFLRERTINSRMLCGRLERVSSEVLRVGDVRAIHSGVRLIHQLFHLDLPSVTIVIRTHRDIQHAAQYKYLPPGLAIDSEEIDGLRSRRLVFLGNVARGQIGDLRKYASKLIQNCDLETLYYLFAALTQRKVDRALLGALYDEARQRHGEVVDLFLRVCEGERRTRVAIALRSKISDPESRFLLALLMLMPDRDAIFDAIRIRYPDDEPLAMIERWLEGLSGKETIGFDFNPVNRLLFRGLVEGSDMEDLLARLRTEFSEVSIAEHRDRLLDHAKQLARSDLFYPLLSRSPLREEIQGDSALAS
jgi:hypothetical protein